MAVFRLLVVVGCAAFLGNCSSSSLSQFSESAPAPAQPQRFAAAAEQSSAGWLGQLDHRSYQLRREPRTARSELKDVSSPVAQTVGSDVQKTRLSESGKPGAEGAPESGAQPQGQQQPVALRRANRDAPVPKGSETGDWLHKTTPNVGSPEWQKEQNESQRKEKHLNELIQGICRNC